MKRILAVISLTYKESVRKRVFLILLFFAIALISSSAFFPVVDPGTRVKLVETWAIRGIAFFTMLMAIFLAGVSLPDDIEAKRVFLLMTKPIPKEIFLLGKLLGFILVLGLFVFSMAIISLIYIRVVNVFTTTTRDEYLNPRQKIAAEEFVFVQNQSQSDRMNGVLDSEGQLRAELRGPGMKNYAFWKFRGLNRYFDLDDYNAFFKSSKEIELEVNPYAVGAGAMKNYTDLAVTLINPTISTVRTTKVVKVRTKRPTVIKFLPRHIDPLGQLNVQIKRTKPASYLKVDPNSVYVYTAPGTFSFEWNFIKTMLLIYLQTILLLAITVAGSTFLSGPVNVFMAMFIYFAGSGMTFFKESLMTMELIMNKLIEIKVFHQIGLTTGGSQAVDTFPLWMMQASKFIMDLAMKIIPDFAVFDGMNYLLKEFALPWSLFPPALFCLVAYGGVALLIAWISLSVRQFG